jgi:hypothetical protein
MYAKQWQNEYESAPEGGKVRKRIESEGYPGCKFGVAESLPRFVPLYARFIGTEISAMSFHGQVERVEDGTAIRAAKR